MITLIATSSTMDMNGIYLGGTGFDFLELYNAGDEVLKLTLVQVLVEKTQLL